jgi:hypothetical protein
MHCQEASIPKAMRAKQMVVHRACMKANPFNSKAPVGLLVALSAEQTPGTSVLPLTEPTGEDSSMMQTLSQGGDGVVHPKPKLRKTWRTARAMQKWQVNTFDANKHKKCAFKRATSWYGWVLE